MRGASAPLTPQDKKRLAEELRLAGWSIERIASELKVGHNSVSRWTRHAPRPARFAWTRELVLAKFKEWEEEFGRPATSTDWLNKVEMIDGHRKYPTAGAVQNLFGSWSRGLRAAGYKPRYEKPDPVRVRKKEHKWWTKEEIIQLIQEWHAKHGMIPSIGQWQNAEEGRYPTLSTITRHFGSWNDAIREAGFVPFPVGPNHKSIKKYLPLPRSK